MAKEEQEPKQSSSKKNKYINFEPTLDGKFTVFEEIIEEASEELLEALEEADFYEVLKCLPEGYEDIAEELYTFFNESQLEEKVRPLTYAQRRRRAQIMKRYASKLKMARERLRNRRASEEKLQIRARRKAIGFLRARILKNRSYADLSSSEKVALDKRLARIPDSVIARIAKRQLGKVRQAETERLMSLHQTEPHQEVHSNVNISRNPGLREGRNYYTGLSDSTAAKRRAHFKKNAAKDDDDPSAYEKAPGDARAKTKPSVHTKRFKQLYGEAKELMEAVEALEENTEALKNKAEKTGVAYSIIKKVYDRGVAAWKSGHRPGTTPAQWGMARVNSFLTGGKTRQTADADLWKQVKEEKRWEDDPMHRLQGTDELVAIYRKDTPGMSEEIELPKKSMTLGIPRDKMPQIDPSHIADFIQYLKSKSVDVSTKEMDPKNLIPTQNNFNLAKVKSIMNDHDGANETSRHILVSKDNFVLDGHHRWLAHKEKNRSISVHQLDVPVEDAIAHMIKYPKSYTKQIQEERN